LGGNTILKMTVLQRKSSGVSTARAPFPHATHNYILLFRSAFSSLFALSVISDLPRLLPDTLTHTPFTFCLRVFVRNPLYPVRHQSHGNFTVPCATKYTLKRPEFKYRPSSQSSRRQIYI